MLPAVRLLVDHLWEELDRRYGPNPDPNPGPRFTPEQIDVPGLLFVIAKADGRPVGCGALLPVDEGIGDPGAVAKGTNEGRRWSKLREWLSSSSPSSR